MKITYRYPVIPPGSVVDRPIWPLEGFGRRPDRRSGDGAGVGNGPVRIHGAAWRENRRWLEDVSTTVAARGAAILGRDKARYAWRCASHLTRRAWSYVPLSRATDAAARPSRWWGL
jgi:hypothetical protein